MQRGHEKWWTGIEKPKTWKTPDYGTKPVIMGQIWDKTVIMGQIWVKNRDYGTNMRQKPCLWDKTVIMGKTRAFIACPQYAVFSRSIGP